MKRSETSGRWRIVDQKPPLARGRRTVGEGRKNPLRKLYVDRDEVSRVLQLWQQANHPEAEERIREFESLLSSIDRQITELEARNSHA